MRIYKMLPGFYVEYSIFQAMEIETKKKNQSFS